MWHVPKSGRIPSNQVDIFGRTMWKEETKCSLTVQKDRLRPYEQFSADRVPTLRCGVSIVLGGL